MISSHPTRVLVTGVSNPLGAEVARRRLDAASARGFGRNYWPVILNVVDPDAGA